MKNSANVLFKFIDYCLSEAKGDYEMFAMLMFYGMANKETGRKTMERFKELTNSK
ncbi:hypothetical protein [Rhodopseudomonas parapalustris]